MSRACQTRLGNFVSATTLAWELSWRGLLLESMLPRSPRAHAAVSATALPRHFIVWYLGFPAFELPTLVPHYKAKTSRPGQCFLNISICNFWSQIYRQLQNPMSHLSPIVKSHVPCLLLPRICFQTHTWYHREVLSHAHCRWISLDSSGKASMGNGYATSLSQILGKRVMLI